MATFDQLGPEERAVLELLLKRGRSYASVSEMLDLKEDRVAELAHAALADLTPVTSEDVEELDRGAIGNWVIGQATRGEAADARAALSREGAARAWAGSLLDALDGVASAGILPELPELERGGRAKKAGAEDEGARRFLIPGLGALAAALAVALVIVLVTGGDDSNGGGGEGAGTTTNTAAQNQAEPKLELQGQLEAEGKEEAAGVAAVYDQGGQKVLLVQAQLKKNTSKDAYEVWLYNSDSDAQGVGVQVTDSNGVLQGTATLPEGYEKFKTVVLSREQRNTEPTKPSKIVARATLAPAPAQSGNSGGGSGNNGGTGTNTTP